MSIVRVLQKAKFPHVTSYYVSVSENADRKYRFQGDIFPFLPTSFRMESRKGRVDQMSSFERYLHSNLIETTEGAVSFGSLFNPSPACCGGHSRRSQLLTAGAYRTAEVVYILVDQEAECSRNQRLAVTFKGHMDERLAMTAKDPPLGTHFSQVLTSQSFQNLLKEFHRLETMSLKLSLWRDFSD